MQEKRLQPYSRTTSGIAGERANKVKWWRVGEEHSGLRVEAFIARVCPHLAPLSNVASLLRRRLVTMGPLPERRASEPLPTSGEQGLPWRALGAVEGPKLQLHKAKFGERLVADTYIHLNYDVATATDQRPSPPNEREERGNKAERMKETVPEYEKRSIRNSILYKDDHFLAINKPVGLAVQGDGIDVVSLLPYLQHFDDDTVTADEPPRLVHRLDKHTSGVLLLARNRKAASHLGALFCAKGQVRKTYWAVVTKRPSPPEGRIQEPLKKLKFLGGDKTVTCDFDDPDGQKSITEYYSLGHAGQLAIVGLEPLTGRSHQLRVHCASSLGAPILGDVKYGPGVPEELVPLVGAKVDMHLHAKEIRFLGAKGKQVHISAPLPRHWKATLKELHMSEQGCVKLQEERSSFSATAQAEDELIDRKSVV